MRHLSKKQSDYLLEIGTKLCEWAEKENVTTSEVMTALMLFTLTSTEEKHGKAEAERLYAAPYAEVLNSFALKFDEEKPELR